MYLQGMTPWESLLKRMVWRQLGERRELRILDFGSGQGITADHYAEKNDVIAIEPSTEMFDDYRPQFKFKQIVGDVQDLQHFQDGSFDLIICHNVLEYIEDKHEVIAEFDRLLKEGGQLSIVKHNIAGRVMQMVVLLNQFDHAHELLSGAPGKTEQHKTILYYEFDLFENYPLRLLDTYGIRTFWHLQQDQSYQGSHNWQQAMLEIEERVSQLPEFQAIAFFHHMIFEKHSDN